MSALTIGFAATCYGFRRVAHDLPLGPRNISYRRVKRLPFHRLPFAPDYWTQRYSFFPSPPVDAMHFFNGICVNRKLKWLSSIEMEFPRYFGDPPQSAIDRAFELMAQDNCRSLLPLSHAAKRHLLARIPAQWRKEIEPKVSVFTGGVSIAESATQVRQRYWESRREKPRVGFVGRAFWHKGGPALLEAVERVRSQGVDVQLLVVSALESHTHVYEPSDEEIAQVKRKLTETPWIEYHDRIPNDLVLQKMAECDVFLFPSIDESLGWVAIEAAGLGVPTISSNIFALPELVEDGVTGFTIPIPLDQDRRWTGIKALNPGNRPSYQETTAVLAEGIARKLEVLLGDESLRRTMGSAALRKFEASFSERAAVATLAPILETVVA